MKKLLVLLAMVLAFTLTSVAQYGSSSSSGQTSSSDQTSSSSQTSDQTTSGKKSKKSAKSDQMGATEGKSGKAKKEATLTGCLNGDSSGNFTLSNAKHKNGVKVEPADKVKDHSGHQVQLKGEWKGTGADKTFDVASVKHISETCKEAPGGGTTGETKKGKKDTQKGKSTGATPPQL